MKNCFIGAQRISYYKQYSGVDQQVIKICGLTQ